MVAGVLGVAPGAEAGRTTQPPHTLEEATHRMDMILNNTRSRENYIRCFMDKGICNKDALNIKRKFLPRFGSTKTNLYIIFFIEMYK